MDNVSTPVQDTPDFYYILVAPILSLLAGGAFLYFTGTPWNLAPNPILVTILLGMALGTVSYLIVAFLTRLPVGKSLRSACKELRPLFKDTSYFQLFMLAVAAGIGEEILFRGFLQQWLLSFMTAEAAIILAAVLFGMLHFASFGYFVLTTLLGAGLGVVYYLTNSLLLIIVWHAFYDLLAIWVLSRRPELLGLELQAEPEPATT